MKWAKIKRYLPIIGILLFLYILVKLDVVKVWKQLISAEPGFLILAIVLAAIYTFAQPLKWYVIARKQKIRIPYLEAFKIDLISNFYAFVTPSQIGRVMRTEYIKKYSGTIAKGVSNFILEKVFDLISVFFLATVFAIIFRSRFEIISLWYLIAIFFCLIFGLFIFINKRAMRFFGRIFYNFLPIRLRKKVGKAFDDFYENMPRHDELFFIFIINLFIWIFLYFIGYLIGLSLGIEIDFIYYLAIMPISTLVAQIPITIGGIGTREATMIGLFGLFEIPAIKVFSMSLLNIFITCILPILLGIYYSLKIKK